MGKVESGGVRTERMRLGEKKNDEEGGGERGV